MSETMSVWYNEITLLEYFSIEREKLTTDGDD